VIFDPQWGVEGVPIMDSHYAEGYSTVHHLPFEARDARERFAYGDETPSRSTFNSLYTPAESILGITEPEQAYHHAQGFAVNKLQNAVHMVRSACPGDIIEVVHPSGSRDFYLVNPIGFDKLAFNPPANATADSQADGNSESAV
jgi:hypothetical protein